MRILNEVLNSQFYNYFRQYNPMLIIRLTIDLRPNQNRIYIYRYKAYLLNKEQEARRAKRAFKVILRGYIKYLIRYIAFNIYRIQVFQLIIVIIIRNVTFNKNIFYFKKLDKKEGILILVTQKVIILIREKEI